MINLQRVALFALIVSAVISAYIFVYPETMASSEGAESMDHMTMSEEDMDIIADVKERMKSDALPAQE